MYPSSNNSGFGSFFTNLPPVTKNLLLINVLVWAVMALLPGAEAAITRWCALYYFSSPAFYAYQLFSYMFLHASFTHMFFNMFALFMFGRTIELVMGSQRFLFFYLSCGIFAGLVQEAVFAFYINHISGLLPPEAVQYVIENGWSALQQGMNYTDPDMAKLNALINAPMVGASGAVYAILLAFGVLFPNQPIYLYFLMPIKAKWFVLGYFLLELFYGIGSSADGIAHFAHVGGMISGFLLIQYWRRKGVFNQHWFF